MNAPSNSSNLQLQTMRLVYAGELRPTRCVHNIELRQGCFCSQCPIAGDAETEQPAGSRANELFVALSDFLNQFRNRGETTSLHEWNTRMKESAARADEVLNRPAPETPAPLAELVREAIDYMGSWEYDDMRGWCQRAEAALTDGATPVRASTAEVALPKTAEPAASPVHPGISVCPYCQHVNGGHSLACTAITGEVKATSPIERQEPLT